jgi:hypothetical protein
MQVNNSTISVANHCYRSSIILSVKLKQDSEEIVETGTSIISLAIKIELGSLVCAHATYEGCWTHPHRENTVTVKVHR